MGALLLACHGRSGSKQLALSGAGARPFRRAKAKTPRSTRCRGVLQNKSLAMTYFHTGIRTIIGA
ncbi:hypothetical protein, partial [Cupriavidus alkaliphilus]|uniref:hypothetical protein n=1 Tax=Cupriavidus alkaliphilus TaxID=942866 RepID=UPI001C84A49A